MAKRLDKTLADYVVGGVMPALLIGLLCSLCYFLLELAYSGAYMGQLKWILFFFIVGTVLIARISMRGDISERAGIYGICLAIAAGLAMVRFVDIPKSALGGFGWLIPFSMMSIIWWSAHKLTQDSTWDDDEEDDGGGLLDAAAGKAPTPTVPKNKSADWFDNYQADRQEEQRKKKPGLMVVYFSLAALPLFGIGQAMIPATNVEARRYAFWMLTIYVACGLGMLLTTSFLGLRRYLRGRRLQMPASMTGLWLGLGVAMIVTLMVLSAVLLPRPEAEYHVSQLMNWATSKERDANQTHFFEGSSGKSDDPGTGPQNKQQAKAGGKQPGKGQGNQQQQGNQQGNQANAQQDQNGQAGKGGQKTGGKQGQGEQSQGDSGQSKDGQGKNGQGQGKNGQGQQGKGQQGQQGEGSKDGKQGQGGGGSQKKNQAGQGNQQDKNNQQGGKNPSKEGENGKEGQGEGDQQGDQEKREQEQREAAEGKNKQEEQNKQGNQGEQQQNGAANPPPPPPTASTPPASWDWLKWLGYGLMLAGILFALWKWGRQLWNALLQMWRELVAWWQGLLPKKQEEKDNVILDPEARIPPKPFAWFSNPLHQPGNFQSMEEMIRYSFAALHSWAYEQNLGRQPDETPTEFAQRLGESLKHAHQDIRKLADLYSVVTYARVNTPTSSEAILRNFWSRVGA